MAEAAGLALGAVALASLFQTCVEFLEYFEVARNFSGDGELVSTKLGLLETRLKNWGYEMKVLDPGREDGGWHGAALEDEEGVITRCLVGISDILGDASKLRTEYGLDKRKRVDWSSCLPFRLRPPQQAKKRRFSRLSIRKHVVWAVRDKKRFDSLIQDLDFFITNLEKVGSHIANLRGDTDNDHPLFTLQEDKMSFTGTQTNGNFGNTGRQLGTGRRIEQDLPLGSSYDGQRAGPDSHQHCGNIGDVANRRNQYNNQVALNGSYQQLGDSSEQGAAIFFGAQNQQAQN